MRKYSYFYEGIYEKKLGIMRRGVAPQTGLYSILLARFLSLKGFDAPLTTPITCP